MAKGTQAPDQIAAPDPVHVCSRESLEKDALAQLFRIHDTIRVCET